MDGQGRHIGRTLILLVAMAFLWAATPGLGGMAELGRDKDSGAGGNGKVKIKTNPEWEQPVFVGDTVEDVMTALAAQDSRLTYDPDTNHLTIEGFDDFRLESDGADFGPADRVLVMRDSGPGDQGFLYFKNEDLATEAGDGTSRVWIDGVLEADFETKGACVNPAGNTNGEPCDPLAPLPPTCPAPHNTCAPMTKDLLLDVMAKQLGEKAHRLRGKHLQAVQITSRPQSIEWDIDSTDVTGVVAQIEKLSIPTLSGWGIVLLIAVLALAAILLMRRRNRLAGT